MNNIERAVAGVIGAVVVSISASGVSTYNKTVNNDIQELKGLRKSSKWLYEQSIDKDNTIETMEIDIQKLKEEKNELENKLQSKEAEEKKKEQVVTNKTNNQNSNSQLIGVFEATAYDDSPESQGIWVGKTATGMKPAVGVIAVDPNVIPLYTKLEIKDMAGNTIYTGIAGDTGGDIKGNRVDLFHNTRSECYNFGRRQVQVYRR